MSTKSNRSVKSNKSIKSNRSVKSNKSVKSKISVRELNKFLKLFGYTNTEIPKLKADKESEAKKIIKKYKIPKRYLEGLSKEEKFLRQIELVSKKRLPREERYKPLKSDKIAREKGIPKSGSCTQRWNKAHPEAKSNASKSKITGIPKKILDKVGNKGRGAYYSSGSRPGQTSQSWGVARVNCFILNKKTVTAGPDKDLYQEAIKTSPRAKSWFSKTKY